MIAAPILALLISSGIDFVTGLITRYEALPDSDEALKLKLVQLKANLNATKAEVEAVVIKDV